MTDDRDQLSAREREILENFEARLEDCDAVEAEAIAREGFETIASLRAEFRNVNSCIGYYKAKARGLTR